MTLVKEIVDELCLPGRAEAESAISEIRDQGRPAFVLAVLATGVARINEQFGYRAGDRVLAAVAGRLVSAAPSSTDVFRWSATAFLVVARSLTSIRKASGLAGATTALFSILPQEQPRELFDRIDDYILSYVANYEAA